MGRVFIIIIYCQLYVFVIINTCHYNKIFTYLLTEVKSAVEKGWLYPKFYNIHVHANAMYE